jgi:hypothetical protein
MYLRKLIGYAWQKSATRMLNAIGSGTTTADTIGGKELQTLRREKLGEYRKS